MPQSPSLAELSDLSVAVAEIYSDRFGVPKDASWALAKMMEEMGEVSGAWLALEGQSRKQAGPDDLADEVADLLGFLLVFAQRTGVDPAAALQRKWGKHLPEDHHGPERD
jgi:NTP pyrophosphatase (non-canonical NTP hydrolase)